MLVLVALMSSIFSFTPRPFQDVNSNKSNCLSNNNPNRSDGVGVTVDDSSDSELDEVSGGRHKRKQRRFKVVACIDVIYIVSPPIFVGSSVVASLFIADIAVKLRL